MAALEKRIINTEKHFFEKASIAKQICDLQQSIKATIPSQIYFF